ncbi:P-loop containing nucleoside triphosphate hydrolase protein, partial [Boletus coccyginus]
ANCEFVWGMPKGFNIKSVLSGGQCQYLMIARALLKRPMILALDKATSALDATSEHWVNDVIDKILAQTTCVIIMHQLLTIAWAKQIMMLKGTSVLLSLCEVGIDADADQSRWMDI